jgi:hypothetical protein
MGGLAGSETGIGVFVALGGAISSAVTIYITMKDMINAQKIIDNANTLFWDLSASANP